MIGIVLAAVLKVGYILICKVIVMIIFAVLAIQYWVGEDIRKAEEEKRGTWLFTLGFIGLTVLTMLAANIPGQVQRDQYLYLTKEHTEQLEKVLLREATADSERCIQWYEKQMLGIRNNKALGNPAMQTEDERRCLRKRGSLQKKKQRVLEFRPDAVVVSLERYVTLVWQRQLRRPERQTAYRNICADTQKQRSDI